MPPPPILDLLFMRYANFGSYSEGDEQIKGTLCSFMDTWIDRNPEDFCQPSDLLILKYLKASFSVYMANSDISIRVNLFLTLLQEIKKKRRPRIHRPRMRKTHIWGDTHPQIQRYNGCKSAGKTANLEPDPTCAPQLETLNRAPENFVAHE